MSLKMEENKDTDCSKKDDVIVPKCNPKSKRKYNNLKQKYTFQRLTKELAHRQDILKFILYLQLCLSKRKKVLKKLRKSFKDFKESIKFDKKEASTQTDNTIDAPNIQSDINLKVNEESAWKISEESKDAKPLADQIKEAAESALQQTGMVYEETSGMYYDYNTGYYYNPNTGLYYHNSTGCYYYFDEAQNTFSFHSHADVQNFSTNDAQSIKKSKKKEKHKKVNTTSNMDTISKRMSDLSIRQHHAIERENDENNSDSATKSSEQLSSKRKMSSDDNDENHKKLKPSEQDSVTNKDEISSDLTQDDGDKSKQDLENISIKDEIVSIKEEITSTKEEIISSAEEKLLSKKEIITSSKDNNSNSNDSNDTSAKEIDVEKQQKDKDSEATDALESGSHDSKVDAKSDGECSTESSSDDSDSSSSDESVSVQYPPCMRIIVSESSVDAIKVGSLYMLTKEGGTLGREGGNHSVLLPDVNISRHHLSFTYNEEKSIYFVKDMGSRNGTILNGKTIASGKTASELLEVVHGSVIQLGGMKLLCHIHKGNDTCGHCEPGLLIKESKPPVVQKMYRPTNMRTLHQRELRRLKEKYSTKPVKEEELLLAERYEDKAQIRREKVGSSHDAVKTEQASLDANISITNKGYKMLQKMGWSAGEGLGKNTQGELEPVPLLSNIGTSGLGAGSTVTPSPSSGPSSSSSWRQNIRLTTQRRYDKATTHSFFNQVDSDDETEETKT